MGRLANSLAENGACPNGGHASQKRIVVLRGNALVWDGHGGSCGSEGCPEAEEGAVAQCGSGSRAFRLHAGGNSREARSRAKTTAPRQNFRSEEHTSELQ